MGRLCVSWRTQRLPYRASCVAAEPLCREVVRHALCDRNKPTLPPVVSHPVGRVIVQSLVVLLTIQGLPLHALTHVLQWQLPAWLLPVSRTVTQGLGQDEAHAQA